MMRWLKRILGIERLERELEAARAAARSPEITPGLAGAKARPMVTVGGREVDILPLPPLEWARALEDLPGFLLVYASGKRERVTTQQLETVMARAREWLAVCAKPRDGKPLELERLTVPEASHAITVIAQLNGLDEALARFFRERLERQARGPDLETVRPGPARVDVPDPGRVRN